MADSVDPSLQALLRQQGEEIASLRAALDTLVQVLTARGDLSSGHARLLEKVRERAVAANRPALHLNVVSDKYAVGGADIDCASLLHLCKARCCTFTVFLSEQDLEERRLRWDIDNPYVLRKEDDGYCTYFDRNGGGCGAYAHRPATCRSYDCRTDPRVWRDFDKRVPAPLRAGITEPDCARAAPAR